MDSSAGALYTSICNVVGFDPENAGYKAGVYQVMNEQADVVYKYRPWPFAMVTTTLVARGDYILRSTVATPDTALFTPGNRKVAGSATSAWDTTMEPAWIAHGANPEPQDFVRIGRVLKSDELYLVDPYPGTNTDPLLTGAYTIRWRFLQLPRDCLRLDGLGPGENNYNPFEYMTDQEAKRRGFTERLAVGGRPTSIIQGVAPSWGLGMNQSRTPDSAPTAAATAGAGLTSGHVYEYRYTWLLHGTETGSSGIASVTPSAGNLQVTLTGFQEATATDGRYIRVYRRDKTANEPWYGIGDFTGASAATVIDTGLVPDRRLTYYDSNSVYLVRTWPRAIAGTDYNFDVRYQCRPRAVQKPSDYFDCPEDAVTVIKWLTVAELAMKFGKPAIEQRARATAAILMEGMEAAHLSERVQPLMRVGFDIPAPGRRRYGFNFPPVTQT